MFSGGVIFSRLLAPQGVSLGQHAQLLLQDVLLVASGDGEQASMERLDV